MRFKSDAQRKAVMAKMGEGYVGKGRKGFQSFEESEKEDIEHKRDVYDFALELLNQGKSYNYVKKKIEDKIEKAGGIVYEGRLVDRYGHNIRDKIKW